MANEKTNDKSYLNAVKNVMATISTDNFYKDFVEKVANGDNEMSLYTRMKVKNVDEDWLAAIEETTQSLDTIVRNPRKFIVTEEDIIPVSLAKKVTQESIRHLAQHTNLISEVRGDEVIPDKILNVYKEESYEIYENRFIYTLIYNLRMFIEKRYQIIKAALTEGDLNEVSIKSEFKVEDKKFRYQLKIESEATMDELLQQNPQSMGGIQRVARLAKLIDGLYHSPFSKQMEGSAMVRPPIVRTNVILKNPDFKKALKLWQFIETYDKIGFSVEVNESLGKVDQRFVDQMTYSMFSNFILFKEYIDKDLVVQQNDRVTKVRPQFVKSFVNRYVEDENVLELEKVGSTNLVSGRIKKINEKEVLASVDRVLKSYEKELDIEKKIREKQEAIRKILKAQEKLEKKKEDIASKER